MTLREQAIRAAGNAMAAGTATPDRVADAVLGVFAEQKLDEGKPKEPLFVWEYLKIWSEGDDLHIAARDGLPPLEEGSARIISCHLDVADSKWSQGAAVELQPGQMKIGPLIIHTKPKGQV